LIAPAAHPALALRSTGSSIVSGSLRLTFCMIEA
jgi:hypothetical protein